MKEYRNIIFYALFGMYVLYLLGSVALYPAEFQWDFGIYHAAAKTYMAGLNPYDLKNLSQTAGKEMDLGYVYAPVILHFFYPFALFDPNTARVIFYLLKLAALFGLVYLWMSEFRVSYNSPYFYLFLLFAFNGALYLDIRSGNISIFQQLLLWSAFAFYLRKKYVYFSALIILISLFKLTPLFFLLLFLTDSERKPLHFLSSILIFLVIFLGGSYLTDPELTRSFFTSVKGLDEHGIKNPASFPFFRDLTGMIFMKAGIKNPKLLYQLLYVIFSGTVIYYTYRLLNQYRNTDKGENEDQQSLAIQKYSSIFILTLAYALLLPRFKDYAFILLIPVTYLELIRHRSKIALFAILILPFLSAKHVTLPYFDALMFVFWDYMPLLMAILIFLSIVLRRNNEEKQIV